MPLLKKYAICFLLLSLAFCLNAQERVVIAGKVSNPDADVLYLKASPNRVGFLECETEQAVLDNDGRFCVSFNTYISTDVWITYKANFLVMVHPGDSIYLEFDGSPKDRLDVLETVKIEGSNAINNRLAVSFQKLWFSEKHYSNAHKVRDAQENFNGEQYKSLCDSIYKLDSYSVDSFIVANNVSDEFKRWATNNIKLGYYKDLLMYPGYHRSLNKIKARDWSVGADYYNFFEPNFTLTPDDFISAFAIRFFINFYATYHYELLLPKFSHLIGSSNKNDHHFMDSVYVDGLINLTKDSMLRALVLTENFSQSLEVSDVKNFEKHEAVIQKYITQPYLKEPLYRQYNAIKESIKNPKIEVEDRLKKFEGYDLKAVMDDVFANNKGKVIYVDCWATWCSPCLGELPNSKALMQEFKGKDVAFVFLCVDSQEDVWKSTISRMSLEGQHYFLSKKQSSELRFIYNIQGIPHYILYSKNGDLFERSTLRPGEVKDKINKLL